jgi:four helix bundle protein
MMSKLATVEEEADETLYWLELLAEVEPVSVPTLNKLMAETEQILAMTVASLKTLRSNPKSKIQNPKSKIQNRFTFFRT